MIYDLNICIEQSPVPVPVYADRDMLEQLAMENCPPELFYELGDNLENITDIELLGVIDSKFDRNESGNLINDGCV